MDEKTLAKVSGQLLGQTPSPHLDVFQVAVTKKGKKGRLNLVSLSCYVFCFCALPCMRTGPSASIPLGLACIPPLRPARYTKKKSLPTLDQACQQDASCVQGFRLVCASACVLFDLVLCQFASLRSSSGILTFTTLPGKIRMAGQGPRFGLRCL